MAPIRLGFVAAGKRARSLMEHAYTITDQQYLGCEPDDGYNYPHDLYEMFGTETPGWMEDVSGLEAEVSAVFSPSEGSRRQAAELAAEHGDDPALYGEFDAFRADADFDVALVCSPNDLHAQAVVPLLDDGHDVFCEKPLAADLADHDRMIAAEDDASGFLYVGFQRRVSPYFTRIKELIDEGVVGRLGMLNHTEVRDPFHIASPGEKGYRYSQERSGGAILEKNSHEFDVFNWYTGADPVSVSAFGGQHVLSENTDILDQATINVQYDNGAVANVELCLYNGAGLQDIYDVRVRKTESYRGSEGIIRVPDEDGVVEIDRRNEQNRVRVSGETVHGGDVFQIHRLLQCARGEAEPPVDARGAKKAAAVAIGAERSVREGGAVVSIDDDYDVSL
jgi:predicted dehydrogenase